MAQLQTMKETHEECEDSRPLILLLVWTVMWGMGNLDGKAVIAQESRRSGSVFEGIQLEL